MPAPHVLPPPQAAAAGDSESTGAGSQGGGGVSGATSSAAAPKADAEKERERAGKVDWRFGHLTNYAINRAHPSFHAGEGGSKRSLVQAFDQLAQRGMDTEKLWAEIGQVVVEAVNSALMTAR